jgi:hypothetical protein
VSVHVINFLAPDIFRVEEGRSLAIHTNVPLEICCTMGSLSALLIDFYPNDLLRRECLLASSRIRSCDQVNSVCACHYCTVEK